MKPNIIYKFLFILLVLTISGCKSEYKKGAESYQLGNYDEAYKHFLEVPENSKDWDSALVYILRQEARVKELERQKYKVDSIARAGKIKQEREALKDKLIANNKALGNFNNRPYRGSVDALLDEIDYFRTLRKLIVYAENDKSSEIKKLGISLKPKVIALQRREFPKMRKAYAEECSKMLWEDNIKVQASGSNYNTLVFIGAEFADNANIAKWQRDLGKFYKPLRFKYIKYKWFDYASEFKRYEIRTDNDADLVY